jgi:hypothetical protein
MNLGNITLITPPDRLFNSNLCYLLVKPSNYVKEQFQTILSQSIDDLNVYIYDNDDTDLSWLLSVSLQADCIIIDIDNCDPITIKFVTFLLAHPKAHYLTKDEATPYNLISKNRIWDLDWIIKQIEEESEEGDDTQEE